MRRLQGMVGDVWPLRSQDQAARPHSCTAAMVAYLVLVHNGTVEVAMRDKND